MKREKPPPRRGSTRLGRRLFYAPPAGPTPAGGTAILPLTSTEHTAIARQLGIEPSNLQVVDDDYRYPGHIFRYFSRIVTSPETGHLMPEIRMIRLYVHGRRASLERRWHPEYGLGDWTIVCPGIDVSARDIAAVWAARSLAAEAAVRLGRPTGPTPGSDVEYWLGRVDAIGEPTARAEYYARTARKNDRYKWWNDNVLRTLRRRKQRQ